MGRGEEMEWEGELGSLEEVSKSEIHWEGGNEWNLACFLQASDYIPTRCMQEC